jgi:rhodanese-related sulfurtransferase
MSAIAARALVKLGFANVWNVDGGMIAWEQPGRIENCVTSAPGR